MDQHVFRYWPVAKWMPSHYQNQCWFAMNTRSCIHIFIKRHLSHFYNNKVNWVCTEPGTSWPRGWWRHRTFPNFRYQNSTNIRKNLHGSVGNGATLWTAKESPEQTGLGSRSWVLTGLGHHKSKVCEATSWKSPHPLTMWFPEYHCTINQSH